MLCLSNQPKIYIYKPNDPKKISIVFPISVTQSNGQNVESTYPQQQSGPPENDPVALLCGCLAGLLNNTQGQGQGGRMDDDDGGGRVPLQQQIITTSASGKMFALFICYFFFC